MFCLNKFMFQRTKTHVTHPFLYFECFSYLCFHLCSRSLLCSRIDLNSYFNDYSYRVHIQIHRSYYYLCLGPVQIEPRAPGLRAFFVNASIVRGSAAPASVPCVTAPVRVTTRQYLPRLSFVLTCKSRLATPYRRGTRIFPAPSRAIKGLAPLDLDPNQPELSARIRGHRLRGAPLPFTIYPGNTIAAPCVWTRSIFWRTYGLTLSVVVIITIIKYLYAILFQTPPKSDIHRVFPCANNLYLRSHFSRLFPLSVSFFLYLTLLMLSFLLLLSSISMCSMKLDQFKFHHFSVIF